MIVNSEGFSHNMDGAGNQVTQTKDMGYFNISRDDAVSGNPCRTQLLLTVVEPWGIQ